MKKYNPCDVKEGVCLRGRSKAFLKLKRNFCCKDCEHLKDTGCSVESIQCKQWLCNEAQSRLGKREHDELLELRKEVDENGFNYHRCSKEQTLKMLKAGREK